jgi:poly-gamma-glutamate synthesis protein (capsule biosynthesis protein)
MIALVARLRVSLVALVAAAACISLFVAVDDAMHGRYDLGRRPSDPATFVPLAGEPLQFAGACDADQADVVTLGFLGDTLFHNQPYKQIGGAAHIGALWSSLAPLFASPDLTYANMEGTFTRTPRAKKTNGKNRLKYPPELARALKDSGVDVVSLANNHAGDGGARGMTSTLEIAHEAGLLTTGTRMKPGEPWHVVTEVKGLRIAWVSCTEWTNKPVPFERILHCHRDKRELLALVRELARTNDVVIATPHGGFDLPARNRADKVTRALQRDLVNAGALLVIGNHPHVVQQWEKVPAPDGREAFVSSCNGAGFTKMKASSRRDAVFLVAGISKDARDGKVRVRGVRHVPLIWHRVDGKYAMEAAALVPDGERTRARVHKLMSEWNESPPTAPVDPIPDCNPSP